MAVFTRPLFSPSMQHDNQELVERLRWVIGLRWSVVLALFLVTLFVGLRGNLETGYSRENSLAHMGLALLVLAYNLSFLFVSRRPGFGQSGLTKLIRYGQVPVDLMVVTLLIHLTGGVTGPVAVLYFVYVFVGLAILPPSGAYWVAGIATLFFGLLSMLEALGFEPPSAQLFAGIASPPVSTQIYLGYFLTVSATLMITAYVANYFAGLLTRDDRTIRRQLSELNTLYTVTRKMATTLDSDEVMRTLLNVATEVEHPDACWIMLFTDQGKSIFGASVGITPGQRANFLNRAISTANPLVRQVISDRKGIYAPVLGAIPDLSSLVIRASTRSFYAVPMVNEQRLIGMLNLCYDNPYTMPSNRWELLGTVAQQASLAMERARLFSDAERAAREMTGLYQIGLATTSSLQIDEVLRLIYEQVNSVFHPDTFYIGLYEEGEGEIRFDLFVEDGEFLPPFRTRMEGGISAWVIRNRRPVFVRNWNAEIEQLPFEAGVVGAPTQSVLSVPLTAKNKMVGVMSVQALNTSAFDHDHLRLLTSIASQAALALENARLHAQVFDQAQRDPLTGVFNHGTFIDKLSTAVREAGSNKSDTALIMLDIDRFKQYNDTYGHMVGDDVLRSIVLAIQNHLKSTDIVGRWGGEEFGIILQDVNRAQARLIAERIRQTAARAVFTDLHNRSIPSPTVSQGLAMFPDDATALEELIDKADSALYRAKDLGRNQIAEWIDLEGSSGPISFRARG